MSSDGDERVDVEQLEAGRIIRELEVESRGDAVQFLHRLIDFIDGQKTAQRAWGTYSIDLNYRGKGLDGVDITDRHSIKFKPKTG